MDNPPHSKTRTALPITASRIHITGGIPHNNNTWLYSHDLLLSNETPGKNVWAYYFTPNDTPPNINTTWTTLHNRAHLSASEIPGITNTPGYYYITNRLPATNPIKIIRFRLASLHVSKRLVIDEDKRKPVILTYTTEPAGYETHVNADFRKAPGAKFRSPDMQDFEPLDHDNTALPSGTSLAWTERGKKTITLTVPGNPGTPIDIYVATLIPAQENTLVVVNGNDSDNDGRRDFNQKTMSNNTADPDLRKFELLLHCPADDPGEEPLLSLPLSRDDPDGFVREFFQDLHDRDATFRIRRHPLVQLYTSPAKGPSTDLLTNDDIENSEEFGDFFHEVTYNGVFTETFVDLDFTDALELFDQLYLEGIRGSNTNATPILQISIYDIELDSSNDEDIEFNIFREEICGTVIHLRMNHSPNVKETGEMLKKESWHSDPQQPLNSIPNPAVILLPDPEDPQPDPTATFQLDRMKQSLLDHDSYRDYVQWSVTPLPDIIIPFHDNGEPAPGPIGDIIGGNAVFIGPSTGRTVSLQGTREGFIRIGVRLKDTSTDYLTFNALVAPEIKVPYAFQLFTSTPAGNEDPIIAQTIQQIPELIKSSNILLRQVGMKFIPAEPTSLTPLNRIDDDKMRILSMADPFIPKGALGSIPGLLYFSDARMSIITNDGQILKYTKPDGTIVSCENLRWSFKPHPDGNRYLFLLPRNIPLAYLQSIPQDNLPLWIIPTISQDTLPHRIIPGQYPILVYNNLPQWLCNNHGTHLIPSVAVLPHIFNINIVKNLQNSNGYTSMFPPGRIGSWDRTDFQLPSETNLSQDIKMYQTPEFWGIKETVLPDKTIATDDLYSDLRWAVIKYRNANVQNHHGYYYNSMSRTIVHEFGHTTGLRHRNPSFISTPPPGKSMTSENDEITSTGFIPALDHYSGELQTFPEAAGNNFKNIMTLRSGWGIDIDLTQAIILRSSIFPQPDNP